MKTTRTGIVSGLGIAALVVAGASYIGIAGGRASACGGFFCQQVPINQAAEQIIFRKDGSRVRAIVLIQYQGSAEDFSWVLPVPGVPELSVGSDLLFQTLEATTRPQFTLEVTGEACFTDNTLSRGGLGVDVLTDAPPEDDGVEVLQELAVGPFDIQIVRSENPDAMTQWLDDNNYDLTDRGRELIAPYVEEGMNFVAMRLQQDKGVGDIEPIQLVYESERPMIPIRLTAVATQPNLGVLVWILGDSQAIPVNYLHVTPNYAQLDWYSGARFAYLSYQNLVTAAMDEVGGQGFATDYAGRDADLISPVLDLPEQLRADATRLSELSSAANALAQLINFSQFPGAKVLEIYRRRLPLPDGVIEASYGSSFELARLFDDATLRTALDGTLAELETDTIEPLEASLTVFDGDPYMTRLFTALSAEDMTLDPIFGFSGELADQQLERKATLALSCVLGQTQWSLTLGEGTGRAGELVMEGTGARPFSPPVEILAQSTVKDASFIRESSLGGGSTMVVENSFDAPFIRNESGSGDLPLSLCGQGLAACGPVSFGTLFATLVGMKLVGRRGRKKGTFYFIASK